METLESCLAEEPCPCNNLFLRSLHLVLHCVESTHASCFHLGRSLSGTSFVLSYRVETLRMIPHTQVQERGHILLLSHFIRLQHRILVFITHDHYRVLFILKARSLRLLSPRHSHRMYISTGFFFSVAKPPEPKLLLFFSR